jgi:hypothetical protein
MAYVNDGSVHKTGIRNEHRVVAKINEGKIPSAYGASATASQLGGTKNKADMVVSYGSVKERAVSIKKKEGTKTGSYDYINSSAAFRDLLQSNGSAQNVLTTVRNIKNGKYSDKSTARKAFNQASYNCLKSISSQELEQFLKSYVYEPYEGLDIVISDREVNVDHFAEDFMCNSDIGQAINDPSYIPVLVFKNGRAATSATIIFTKNGRTYDFGLRIRLVLNNGIGALMGLSTSNSSSSPVLKLQQDKVNKVIERNQNIFTTF